MKSQTNRGELLLRGPGRDKLLAYARSFEGLSRSFYYLPDKPPETQSKRELLWHNRLAENRLVTADQLREVSKIITGMADEIVAVEDVGAKREERLKKVLKHHGILAEDVLLVENREQRMELYMTARADYENRIAVAEVAEIISEVLKYPMVPAREQKPLLDENPYSLRFEEEPQFHILTGFAGEMKTGETESGDSYSVTFENRGRLILSLSDGMGSGSAAAYESRIVIELLEQFLEAGFDREAAALMINGAMLGRGEEQKISTLDVFDIDLYSGVMHYLKAGAVPTFLKRGERVFCIPAESVPLGIFHDPHFDKGHKKLYDGDILVMMTDGALDSFGELEPERKIERILKRLDSTNPREIAGKLMEMTRDRQTQGNKDDISILTASIWRNK